jgi:hypothetical protein
MIYLRLAGGLGNQLYQLAAASLVSHKSAVPERVVPLVDGLGRYEEPRTPDFIELVEPNPWLLSPDTPVPAIWRALTVNARAGRWMPMSGISDRNYWQVLNHNSNSIRMLDGYFQQGWTQSAFECALANMPIRAVAGAAVARIADDEVVIHIRGGDFLRHPQFQVVGTDYYLRAIKQAMESGLQRFAVISDDATYAYSICTKIAPLLPLAKIRMIPPGVNALEDFDTLRAASARIIGNSTFAWWAAALGGRGRPTWSPTKFTNDTPRDFFLADEIPINSCKVNEIHCK